MICAVVLITYGEFCCVTRLLISNLYSLEMYDCFEVSMPSDFPSYIVYRQYLPRSSFHRLARSPCRLFLSYSLHVLTSGDDRSLLRWLMARPRTTSMFSHCDYIYRTFAFSLTQRIFFLSLYVVLSILHTLVWRPQVCSVLAWSVSGSLHHMS